MSVGGLLGLWFQSLFVGLTMKALSICIMPVSYTHLDVYKRQRLARAERVPLAQLVRLATPALKARPVLLPRQYMHNKENAVTMRLSAH